MKTALLAMAGLGALAGLLHTTALAASAPTAVEILGQLDFDGSGSIEEVEMTAGLEHQVETAIGRKPVINLAAFKGKKGLTQAQLGALDPAMPTLKRIFIGRYGPPPYLVTDLAGRKGFDAEREFALGEALLDPPLNRTDKWTMDGKPLRVRRTIEDFHNDNAATAKGALVSYANDFNIQSEQWAFHGVIGLNLSQTRNPAFGADEKGVVPPRDAGKDAGFFQRWLRPSIALDKVTTSQSDRDEIDSLVPRLSFGGLYVGGDWSGGLFDGFAVNVGGSYATDTNNERSVLAGELDFTPYREPRRMEPGGEPENRFGLNSRFQRVGFVFFRPELLLHLEGGTVIEDGEVAALVMAKDFLRVGGTAGVTFGFPAIERLMLHAHFQYGVEVAGEGPDVDLFVASGEWRLDDDGHFTLTVEYRNGRSPLLLQRDNRLTVGLGVKF